MIIDTQKSTECQDAKAVPGQLQQLIREAIEDGDLSRADAQALGSGDKGPRTLAIYDLIETRARKRWVATADPAWHRLGQDLYSMAHPEPTATAQVSKSAQPPTPEEVGRVVGELVASAALSLPEARGATGIDITWGPNGEVPQDPLAETVSLAAISAAQALYDLTGEPVYREARRFLEE